MADFIYTPGIKIYVDSALKGLIDLSDDIESARLSLVENGLHTLQVTLSNPRRKYDGIFAPNDRVSCSMKRLEWLQVFTGYTTSVPYFNAFHGSLELTCNCTLKTLKFFPWDARSVKAIELFNKRDTTGANAADAGIADYIVKLMTEVVGWPKDHVHIGGVPTMWQEKFRDVYSAVKRDADRALDSLGPNPWMGQQPTSDQTTQTSGTGTYDSAKRYISGLSDYTVLTDNDIDVAIATIRTMETRSNYTQFSKGDSQNFTGAYAYATKTWNNYGGYKEAYLAPPEVQDRKAADDVRRVVKAFGAYAIYIPIYWFWPIILADPTNPKARMDYRPYPKQNNNISIREYADRWMREYHNQYRLMRGHDVPKVTTTPTGTTVIPSTGEARYPIAIGVNQLSNNNAAWGGYTNGHIPLTALRQSRHGGYAHPVAAQAWDEMWVEANKKGFDLKGDCYRSYEKQEANTSNPVFAPVAGTSMHGWGVAFDINCLVANNTINTKYPQKTVDEMYSTDEYLWLKENAWKYGFSNPSWATQSGGKKEPWHWEFLAITNFKNSGTPGLGGTGWNPFSVEHEAISQSTPNDLFTAMSMFQISLNNVDQESIQLSDMRALMNDVPIIAMIQQWVTASMRKYCSAPNGDFIAWFPDYWGEYGLAGSIELELIELKNLSVEWSDESLITHQFIEGSSLPQVVGSMPGGQQTELENYLTNGVVTVDLPNLLRTITNIEKSPYPFLADPAALLQRFGARIARDSVPSLQHGEHEFWYALNEFLSAWAGQFSCSVDTTFLPEAFPGMILKIPAYGIQFYINRVSHSADFGDGQGFSTSLGLCAPSATDGSGFYLFPTTREYIAPNQGGAKPTVTRW